MTKRFVYLVPAVVLTIVLPAQAAPPSTPTNVDARPSSMTALPITLHWDAVGGATSYNVYRSTSAGAEGTVPFATTTTNSFVDSNVVKGPPPVYFYKVAAVSAGGTSALSAETSTPTPLPVSAGSGNVAGVVQNGRTIYFCRDALLDGFDWFQPLNGWFPQLLGSSGAISPGQLVVDMAYSQIETMSFNNVSVPASGLYTLAFRYAFAPGLFPNVTNRQMGLRVNGAVITTTMRYPRTGSFDVYQESAIQVRLNAGRNAVVLFAVSDHGLSRIDTLAVSPAIASAPAAPTNLVGKAGSNSVQLTWTAGAGATSYNVYRGTVSDGEALSPIGMVGGGTPTLTFVDNGVANGTKYFYNVAGLNSVGISPSSNEISIVPTGTTTTPPPAPAPAPTTSGPVSIACGNGAVGAFIADAFFSGGAVSSGTTGIVDTSTATSPAPMAVYQHGRKSPSTYTIPNLSPGSTHTVRLHFAEYFRTAAGQRQFHVTINGAQVLTNFDIFAAAGGSFRANVQSFTATANASGQIVIAFTNGAADMPLVSGIEIK